MCACQAFLRANDFLAFTFSCPACISTASERVLVPYVLVPHCSARIAIGPCYRARVPHPQVAGVCAYRLNFESDGQDVHAHAVD